MKTLGLQQYITIDDLKKFDPKLARLPNGNIVAIGVVDVYDSGNSEVMHLNLYRPIEQHDQPLSPDNDWNSLTDWEEASNNAEADRENTEVFSLRDYQVYPTKAVTTVVTTIVVTTEDGTDVFTPDRKWLNIAR